jgi:hypothetical protein
MTAINVFRLEHSVHILTDGGVYDPDGKLIGFMNKAWPIPHLNAVFAMRGPTIMVVPIALALMSTGGGYDALRGRIVDLVRTIYTAPEMQPAIQATGHTEADFVVAGYSETHGPHAYSFHSHDREGVLWRQSEIEQFYISPGDASILDTVITEAGVTAQKQFNAIKHGLEIMELQRKLGGSSVSGFAQLTTITAYGGITTRIIRRWSDKVRQAEVNDIRSVLAAGSAANRFRLDVT